MGEELLWAVKNGDLDNVTKIIGEKKVDVNNELSSGRSPLHFATDYGQLNVCEYLVLLGADINQKDKHGITPLLAAIWEGHIEVCQFLISNGAEKNGTAPNGVSYLDSTENEEIRVLLK